MKNRTIYYINKYMLVLVMLVAMIQGYRFVVEGLYIGYLKNSKKLDCFDEMLLLSHNTLLYVS